MYREPDIPTARLNEAMNDDRLMKQIGIKITVPSTFMIYAFSSFLQ
jgi:hypothetical protein